MHFLWSALIGLIVGAIAKLLISGTGPVGCIPTALLGIAGSVLAAVAGQAMGWYLPGEPAGFIGSILGAVLLLWAYKILKKA